LTTKSIDLGVRVASPQSPPAQRRDARRLEGMSTEAGYDTLRDFLRKVLAEAVARLVAEARVVSEEEAQQKAARLFGWKRNGAAIQAALVRVVETLSDDGRVERESGELRSRAGGGYGAE